MIEGGSTDLSVNSNLIQFKFYYLVFLSLSQNRELVGSGVMG